MRAVQGHRRGRRRRDRGRCCSRAAGAVRHACAGRRSANGFYGNVYTAFQANTPLRRPIDDDKKVYPFYQYLDSAAFSPAHNLSMSTFVRAREVANGDDATLDVYNANLEYRSTGARCRCGPGRQILTEGTNFILMDGALLRAKPLDGIDLVAYGGYQDADLQPYPERPDRSFGIFGAKLRSTRLLGSLLTLGYEGLTPDGDVAAALPQPGLPARGAVHRLRRRLQPPRARRRRGDAGFLQRRRRAQRRPAALREPRVRQLRARPRSRPLPPGPDLRRLLGEPAARGAHRPHVLRHALARRLDQLLVRDLRQASTTTRVRQHLEARLRAGTSGATSACGRSTAST